MSSGNAPGGSPFLRPLASASEPRPAISAGLPQGRGERVLVVDDEGAVRTMASHLLKRFGYEVIGAEDGQEALAIYQREGDRIALVFTDMMMPRMDGGELIAALRALNAQVRIIATSGVPDMLSALQSGRYGAIRVLSKPYTLVPLLTAVRCCLDEPVVLGSADPVKR